MLSHWLSPTASGLDPQWHVHCSVQQVNSANLTQTSLINADECYHLLADVICLCLVIRPYFNAFCLMLLVQTQDDTRWQPGHKKHSEEGRRRVRLFGQQPGGNTSNDLYPRLHRWVAAWSHAYLQKNRTWEYCQIGSVKAMAVLF